MLKTIIFSSLGQLATGILLFIVLVPTSKIGRGFGRFHTALAWVLWILALWGRFPFVFWILTALLALAFFAAGRDRVYYPFLLASIVTSFHLLFSVDLPRFGWMAATLIHLPPTLVLGSSSVAMLLGHWYLVAPQLSIRFLKLMTIGLIASLVIRALFLAQAVRVSQAKLVADHFFEIYGIFFLQRVLLGIILTLVLSVLTYFCVRIRSTQSATGILYVVLVFCLVGELIGTYLFAKTGIIF